MIENQQDLITELQKHSGFSDSIDLSQYKDQILKNKPNPQWIIKDSKIDNDIKEIIKESKLRYYSAHKNINSSKVFESMLNQAFPKKRKKKIDIVKEKDKADKHIEVQDQYRTEILEGCNLKEKLEHQKESTLEFSFIKKCCTIVVHQQIKYENNKIFNSLKKHPEFSKCFATDDKGVLKINPSNKMADFSKKLAKKNTPKYQYLLFKKEGNAEGYLYNTIKSQFEKLFRINMQEDQDPGYDTGYLNATITSIFAAAFAKNAYKIEKRLQLAKENGALGEDGEYADWYKDKCRPEIHPERKVADKEAKTKVYIESVQALCERLPDGEFLPDEESIRHLFFGETKHYISKLKRESNKRREKKLTAIHIDKLNTYKNNKSGALDLENFIIEQLYKAEEAQDTDVTINIASKGSIKVYSFGYSLTNEKTIMARIEKSKYPGIVSTEHAAAIQEGVTIYWRENILPETNNYYEDDEDKDVFNDTIPSSETSERIKETDEEFKSMKAELKKKLSGDEKNCVHYLTQLHSDKEADKEADKFKKTMDNKELTKWKRKCLEVLRRKASDPQLKKMFKEMTGD